MTFTPLGVDQICSEICVEEWATSRWLVTYWPFAKIRPFHTELWLSFPYKISSLFIYFSIFYNYFFNFPIQYLVKCFLKRKSFTCFLINNWILNNSKLITFSFWKVMMISSNRNWWMLSNINELRGKWIIIAIKLFKCKGK